MIVYLDMDGVLVDFIKQAGIYRCFKKNGKINWNKIIQIGSTFWETMDWMPGAEFMFRKICEISKTHNVIVKILSCVGFEAGIKGKIQWLKRNTVISEDNIVIVSKAKQKSSYANTDSVLIDDDLENIKDFKRHLGNAIHHKNPKDTVQELKKLVVGNKMLRIKNWSFEFNPEEYAKERKVEFKIEDILKHLPEVQKIQDKMKKVFTKNCKRKETYDLYFNKAKGKYCLVRKIMHFIIKRKFISKKAILNSLPVGNEKPRFVVVCGRPGAGKTKFEGLVYNDANKKDTSKYIRTLPTCIVANSDKIKEYFLGYNRLNASLYQKESAELMNSILREIIGLNIVYDCTISDYKNVKKWIDYFKNKDYEIEIHYMYVPLQVAARRSLLRFINSGKYNGRYVPIEIIIKKNEENEKNFMAIISKYNIKKWSFWDNSEENSCPKLVKKVY